MEHTTMNATSSKVTQAPKNVRMKVLTAIVWSAAGTALIGAVVKGLAIVLYGH